MRFRPGSYEYRIIREWVADGAPGPLPAEPNIAAVEVTPSRRLAQLSLRSDRRTAPAGALRSWAICLNLVRVDRIFIAVSPTLLSHARSILYSAAGR